MLNFRGKSYFLVPKSFGSSDIEFNIFNKSGKLLGTNFTSIGLNEFDSAEEKNEFDEFILDYTTDIEINLKFEEEFKIRLQDYNNDKSLIPLTIEEIVEIMDSRWNIHPPTMTKTLLSAP